MKTYPSRWYRVEQRGCTPNAIGCLHLDWPIERCDVRPGRSVTRHVVPKRVLMYCLDSQTVSWDAVRDGKVWSARGRKTVRSRLKAASGRTEREALQNLCAEMKVQLP